MVQRAGCQSELPAYDDSLVRFLAFTPLFYSPHAHLILLHKFRSLEKGLFKNDVNPSNLMSCCVHTDENKNSFQAWISFFGLVAAIASFRNGWKATALPPSTPSTPLSPPEPETEDTPRISDKQQGSATDVGYEVK